MKILWSPTSRLKIISILEYISQDNPDAALSLINTLEEKVHSLIENPNAGRPLPDAKRQNVRELVVHKNYGVIYEISPGLIEVLTIRHFRQDFDVSDI